jgi:AraC-like DNA-binding protein
LLASETLARHFPRSTTFSEFAQRTLDNPYTGIMSELFLEGCVLAMIAEATRLIAEDSGRREASGLSTREFERAAAARNIVDRDIVSRQFRLAFGDTIFGYVRNRRLEIAQMLLRNEALSIAETGFRVGFANAGAFATAYRKRFGHPPSADRRER